jgi:osmoprotectant transport system substrate-binding protein
VEVLPEYAGAAVEFLSHGAAGPSLNPEATHDALTAALAGRPLQALAPSPAQDANTFVVTSEVAQQLGLRTLSDVARVADELTLGGPPECPRRPNCLAGLRDVYSVEFQQFVPLDVGGPVTLQALLRGDVDVALLFTTDPSITQNGLIELVDDRHLQPAENVTPVVRTEVVERWGTRAVGALDEVSQALTTETLRQLNAAVAGGTPPAAVAAAWLAGERSR